MATLFFGAAKGLTGLMGLGTLMFGMAVQKVAVQMEAIELDAAEAQDAVPLLLPIPAE
ncbi:MAG: hypothetical protein QNL68_11820 [Akkermansiaceae bacterium]|jgi:hypothetical protein